MQQEQELVADNVAVQIGEAEEDHKYCLRAELDDITPRTVYTVDRNHPGGDAVGMAAAAFAACAMALRKVSNKNALANKCMSRARKLYSAGKGMRVCYSDSIPECAKTYPTDNWQQFMMMGAAWMYRATEDKQYRQVRWRCRLARECSARGISHARGNRELH